MPSTKICAIFWVCTHDHLITSVFSPDLRDIKVSRHLPSIFLLHVLVSEAQYWWSYQLLSRTHCKVWLISANQPNFLSVTLIFRTKRPSHVLHQQNTSFKRGPTHVSTDAHKWFILTSSIIRESPAAERREDLGTSPIAQCSLCPTACPVSKIL